MISVENSFLADHMRILRTDISTEQLGISGGGWMDRAVTLLRKMISFHELNRPNIAEVCEAVRKTEGTYNITYSFIYLSILSFYFLNV